VGGVRALGIIFLRNWVPESPRWLMTHGQEDKAHRIVAEIEARVEARHGKLPPLPYGPVRFRRRGHTSLREVLTIMLHQQRRRTVLGVTLMACQAFCYNAIFFTYALVLTKFYGIASQHVGWYLLPFALGNLLGPLLMGPLFDSVGRKVMITLTYAMSGILMAASAFAFQQGWLSAWEQTLAWTVIFFFASPAASAAYLTVGEAFPLEMRAIAIALFYAFGTAIGGVAGPALFGWLIEGGQRGDIFWGFLLAAVLMLVAAATEWRLGFAAERMPLEDVAPPLGLDRGDDGMVKR
jgi:MFS family permease